MSQSTRNVLVIVAVLVLLVGGVWWSEASKAAPAGRLNVAGDVRAEVRTISAPALTYPTPDYTVGIPKPAGSSASAGGSSSQHGGGSTAQRSGSPVVAGMLKHVYVREGDTVAAGQTVAQFDTAMLALGVVQAKTTATKAHKDVTVLSKNLDKLITASSKLVTARGTLATAATKLATAKAGLVKAKAALLKAKAGLLAQQKQLLWAKAHRTQLEQQLAALKAYAGTLTPGPELTKTLGEIKSLTIQLASIDPGLKGIAAGLKTIDANLAKVDAGMVAIQTGYAALAKGKALLATGASQLATAKKQLRDAKDVLKIVAKGQSVAIQLAEARLALATVRSPVAGVVTFARKSGTVAMVGAPLVRVMPSGPQRVDTYLIAEQVAQVAVGDTADITLDSAKGTVLHGAISELGSEYVFPPTSFPTQVVHMTRALKVTIKLDPGSSAPEGTPVDISIHTNAGN